ncbi:MAG: cation transporter [Bacteroidales bacterium]|nr:cation transporter [Bacteroidales bacterium]
MKKLLFSILAFALIFCANAQTKKNLQTIEIQTNGVCEKCQTLMMENIPYEKGVSDCTYDMHSSKLTVTYNPAQTNPDKLRSAVSKLGYNADNVKADSVARAKLPACCKAPKGNSSCQHGHAGCQHSQGTCPHHQAQPATQSAQPASKQTAPASAQPNPNQRRPSANKANYMQVAPIQKKN